MLISRNILQSFFSQTLPSSDRIARELTMKSFEVESVEERVGDEVFEVDVLPNRASDCLSHLGIAREISVIFDLTLDSFDDSILPLKEIHSEKLIVTSETATTARFVGVLLSGLDNTRESPPSLQNALVALGERSISPIVDVTNYVMLLTGQPLHAYDADMLKDITGEPLMLHVGFSKKGDALQTLDGETHILHETNLLITAGREGEPLGLAGVKGGVTTAVDKTTSRIVLEGASFAPAVVRKSAHSLRLHTGASKRFENGIVSELPIVGIRTALSLLESICPGLVIEALRDVYPEKQKPHTIHLKQSHASSLLGIDIPKSSQIKTLERLGAEVRDDTDILEVSPPWYRPDLRQPVDLLEEIGRLNDYEKIEALSLSKKTASLDKAVILNEVLRDFLVKRGFDEIITRSFHKAGDVELENPLAKNTPFLRRSLVESMKNSLALNAQNAELLELEYVKLFEIGTVFTKDAEATHLILGIQKTKNARTKLVLTREVEEIEKGILLETSGNIDLLRARSETHEENTSFIIEYNMSLVDVAKVGEYILPVEQDQKFNSFAEYSVFPYVLRDVAVWTRAGTTADFVEAIIRKNLGRELRVVTLFDEFEKDFEGIRRTSFAFRLVFQSFDKTLSDEEINKQMMALNKAFSETEGFEIR